MAQMKKPDLNKGDVLQGNNVFYSVVRLLGEGTSGLVAECVNLTTNEAVAVKLIKDPAATSDVAREVDMLQRLADLGHVVLLKDSFQFEGRSFLVFEKLDVCLWSYHSTEMSSMRLPEIRPIAQQLLETLAALRDVSVIHSDLKPENIMMTDRRLDGLKVKLIDFGLACPISDVQQGSEVQPNGYRAPEVAMGCEYACPIDMWGLGCTLAFSFLGRHLLPNNEYQSMKMMVDLLGMPPQHMIQSGVFSGKFFKKDTAEEDDPLFPEYRFLTPEEYHSVAHQSPGKPSNLQKRLKSLDDLVEIYQTVNQDHNLDLRMFVDFIKGLLTVDPRFRLTPEQALGHTFVTMAHLSAGSPYARLSKSNMDQVSGSQPEVHQEDRPAAPLKEAEGVSAGAEDLLPQAHEAHEAKEADSPSSPEEQPSSGDGEVQGQSPLVPTPPQPEEVSSKLLTQDVENNGGQISEGEVHPDDYEAGPHSDEEPSQWLNEFRRRISQKHEQLGQKTSQPQVQDRLDHLIERLRQRLLQQKDRHFQSSFEEKLSEHDSGASFVARSSRCAEDQQQDQDIGGKASEGKPEEKDSGHAPSDKEHQTPPGEAKEITEGQILQGNNDAYRVVRFLGEGVFGRVVECLNVRTDETVAVKMMKDPTAIREAEAEIQMLERIARKVDADRCNMVQYIERFDYSGLSCMVFEKLDISLWDSMKKRGLMLLHEIRPVVQQLLVAFNALKDISLIHTDLKPDNAMFVDRKLQPLRVKLIDFGLTRPTSRVRPGMAVQPVGLRAPEVLLGCHFGCPIDMWSLGVTLIFLLLGEWCFPSCRYQKMRVVVNMLGMPPERMLRSGVYTHHYFVEECDDQHRLKWRLLTPEEYHQATDEQPAEPYEHGGHLSSLDDISDMFEIEHPEQLTDLRMFVNFLKRLLTVDPELRMTPKEALEHHFISMSHLSADSDYSQYCRSKMQQVQGFVSSR